MVYNIICSNLSWNPRDNTCIMLGLDSIVGLEYKNPLLQYLSTHLSLLTKTFFEMYPRGSMRTLGSRYGTMHQTCSDKMGTSAQYTFA